MSTLCPVKGLQCHTGGHKDPQKASKKERDVITWSRCIYMKVILQRTGLSRLRTESGKVLRKKLDHCTKEMERDGWQHQQWRGGR